MKSYLKLLSGALTVFVLLSSLCFAAPTITSGNDGLNIKLNIEGTVDNASEGDVITIEILNKDKASSGILTTPYANAEAFLADFVYMDQVVAGADGYINTSVSVADVMGFYQLRINGTDVEKIYVLSDASRLAVYNQIKSDCASKSEADAVSYLKTTFDLATPLNSNSMLKAFGFVDADITIVKSVNEDNMFKLFNSLLKANNYDITTCKTKVKEDLLFAATLTGVNQGVIDIKDIIADKTIDATNVFAVEPVYIDAYNSLTSAQKTSFSATNFVGKGYTTADQIKTAYKTNVLLIKANSIGYWKDAQDFINNYGAWTDIETGDVEIDITKYSTIIDKDSLYTYMISLGTYTDLAKFVTDINAKITELAPQPGSGTGGSLGGGTGGSSGGGSFGGSGGTAGGTTITPAIPATSTVPTPQTPQVPQGKFSDMDGFDWAKKSVEALFEKGIVSGTGNGKFEPERNVTREEMLVMILRAFGIEISNAASDFTDAASDGWYNSYLAAAKNEGYISGKPDGTFGVGEAVTREDAAVMAYNIAKANGVTFDIEQKESFADGAEVSSYANDAINALKNANVINGKGEGLFAPKATCTRAEAAKIIYTLISR